MKMKCRNLYRIVAMFTALLFSLSIVASASDRYSHVQISQDGTCDFGPDSGSVTVEFSQDSNVAMRIEFYYSVSDAEAIAGYMARDLGYAGLDVKNVPSDYNFGVDLMVPYSVSTTLPNPKYDLENNDILGSRDDEAEIVALGEIIGGVMYEMTVFWTDYRTGASSDYGEWRINAELSKKAPFIDEYTVEQWSPVVTLSYGTQNGAAAIPNDDITNTTPLSQQSEQSMHIESADISEAEIAQRNAILSKAVSKDIMTTITFNQYLSFDQFAAYVSAYNIDISQIQLRGLKEDGTRVSIFSRTDKGFDETEHIVNELAADGGYAIIGITGVNALVDPDMLSAVESDSRTYLADTSGDCHSTQNVSPKCITRNSIGADGIGGYFPQSQTWKLENQGLLIK